MHIFKENPQVVGVGNSGAGGGGGLNAYKKVPAEVGQGL